ncbi:MAG: DUF1028 domain-containing protein [Ignavibacteriales bacterium]|jgi:uncharacterized Ntn-hydrolase superfamily protein|nr:MAG: DUF1028 domain-containing protein [Ignavibacteriales bacterium]
MKYLASILFLVITSYSQTFFSSNPVANTYSIVARDTVTSEMGVAVQSHWFSVGTIVSWGEAGVGVIATQSFVNVSFGPNGLALLRQGYNAQEVLDKLIEEDEGRDFRQLAVLDSKGNVAVYTGKKCTDEAGHLKGNQFSVQANMMKNNTVWPVMKETFETSKGSLAERLLLTLEAAEKAGGDIRGKQSASILVVKAESTGKVWLDRLVDLHIEDHPEPLVELRRLYNVHQAYEHMNKGDLAIEHDDMELAMKEYSMAEELFPENLEMKFWRAVTLSNIGKVEDALPIFKEVFSKDENWKILTPKLIKNELLTVSEEELERILSVGD